MRRREFNASLLIAVTAIQPLLAQAPTKHSRIAIVAAGGKPENISEAGSGFWRAFFGELRRLGHIEGRDLIVERYSAEGHPGRYTDLAREVVSLNPDVISAALVEQAPDSVVVTYGFGAGIIQLTEKQQLPAIYPTRFYTDLGGLLAYGSDATETARQIAIDVHQIFGGAEPGDIPIYQATRFEFVINLKAANALGLTLPRSLLALADEVIE